MPPLTVVSELACAPAPRWMPPFTVLARVTVALGSISTLPFTVWATVAACPARMCTEPFTRVDSSPPDPPHPDRLTRVATTVAAARRRDAGSLMELFPRSSTGSPVHPEGMQDEGVDVDYLADELRGGNPRAMAGA